MCKRVKEGNAQKLWMQLYQNKSPDYFGFAQGFPTSMYTQKGRQPNVY